jgi:two-component system, NarL family, sensor histidine kinase UhpB
MKYTLLSILVCSLCFASHAQDPGKHSLDSMRLLLQHGAPLSQQAHLLAAISFALTETKPDSALQMAKKGATLAMIAKNEDDRGSCFNSIGWAFCKLGRNDSAIYYLNMARDLFHKLGNARSEAKVLGNLGDIYVSEDNNQTALDCLLSAQKLAENLPGNGHQLGHLEKTIGNVYWKQGMNDRAIESLRSAVATFRQLREDMPLANALSSLGIVYSTAHLNDSALIAFREALALEKYSNKTISEAYTLENIAELYLEETGTGPVSPHADSALYYYQQAYDIFQKTGSTSNLAYEEMNIGRALTQLKRYDAAAKDLAAALAAFTQDNALSDISRAAGELSKVYKAKGDYKRSEDYLEQSILFEDSVYFLNQKTEMANMLAKYETEKKDKAIQLLNTQKALADKELSKNRVIMVASLGLLTLVVVLVIVLWRQYRIKQQLKQVQMRNQIASDLHDDIGSSLSSIFLLSNMASGYVQQAEGGRLLDKIGSNAKEVMEKMSDIVWTMNPKNDEGASLKERIEKLVIQVQELADIKILVTISPQLEEIPMPMKVRKNIFLICKEAMHNIVKHAKATSAGISIDITHGNIVLEIKDNGEGFDQSCQRKGNGMQTMAQRAQDCGGTCTVTSSPGQGTSIGFAIPVPHSRYLFA